MRREINQIYVENIGWIGSIKHGDIEEFSVNGEMAPVRWFRQGNSEYNGKYVVQINYIEVEETK